MKIYNELEILYFKEKTGFLKNINSDKQMHLLNKVKAEFKNKNKIAEKVEYQILEEMMNNIENSKKARFDNNKEKYHQIYLIFEIVFYLIKLSTDKRYFSFYEKSHKEYLNTFKEDIVHHVKKIEYEPKVEDFL